ncbi:MAG: GNAT family N-acetyltransferase [Promethearchaeota archaeon]
MTINISSEISITDIPNLLRIDHSIYSEKISAIISSNEYKRWISTKGVHTVVARNKNEIIGQLWAHPVRIHQSNTLIRKRFYWIHNIKVHPTWQYKGIFKQIMDHFFENIISENDSLLLINRNNQRMRFLAEKMHLHPITSISGVIFSRYFVFRRSIDYSLNIVKSHRIPKFWLNHVVKHKKFWIPHFSWDISPVWFSFYFKNQLICIFQVTKPIHPIQGRYINKFPIILHTRQVRYLSFPSEGLKVHHSIFRRLFSVLFSTFSRINALVFTLDPINLSRILHLPRFILPSQSFVLYSTSKDSNVIRNQLDFVSQVILLDHYR